MTATALLLAPVLRPLARCVYGAWHRVGQRLQPGRGLVGTFVAVASLTLLIAPDNFLGLKFGGPDEIRSMLGTLGGWVKTTEAAVDSNTFLPTALFYLLFALPAFFFVPDVALHPPRRARPGEAYRNVFATLKGLRAYTGVGTYMLVTLLLMAAVNVAVPNVCLFAKVVFELKDQQISNLSRAAGRRTAPGGVRGTRHGSLPRRHELLRHSHGARDHPPPAHPRRPHPRRPHMRTLWG